MSDWKQVVGDKLTTPERAVQMINDGDRVVIGMMHITPLNLCRALAARGHELTNAHIDASISTFSKWWPQEGAPGPSIETFFLLDPDRPNFERGLLDYRIAPPYRQDQSRWTAQPIDVFMTQVSPPDTEGYCSFGLSVWGAKGAAEAAKITLAEVNELQLTTAGDNRIHISAIDCFVEAAQDWRPLRPPQRNEEEEAVAQVICAVVAAELIKDGDTIQQGTGKIPAALSLFLDDKHDLGVHTELIFGGIPQLVESGVITGKRKSLKPGKVVGASFGQLSSEDRELVAAQPGVYELYEMAWTNDIMTIAAHDNMVAVNNALLVDFTGQITGESLGTRIYSGAGGGFAFPVGAMHARNGRSITVLPSSAVVAGERRTRILPTLPEGTVVTVPRHYADIFVTEYGIARLKGKTLRERVNEMIAIAHPDFRSELRAEAAKFPYL